MKNIEVDILKFKLDELNILSLQGPMGLRGESGRPGDYGKPGHVVRNSLYK